MLGGLLTVSGCGKATMQLDSTNTTPCGEAALKWTAPTLNTDGTPLTNLAGYVISWGPSAGNYPDTLTINSPQTTSYVLQNIVQNGETATYTFAIQAVNSNGATSAYSTPVTATFKGCTAVGADMEKIPGIDHPVAVLHLN